MNGIGKGLLGGGLGLPGWAGAGFSAYPPLPLGPKPRRLDSANVNGEVRRQRNGQAAETRRCNSATSPSMGTRTWAVVSRSLTVTPPSSRESKSTVTHHGLSLIHISSPRD